MLFRASLTLLAFSSLVFSLNACSTQECATDADCTKAFDERYECRTGAAVCVKRAPSDGGLTHGSDGGGKDAGVDAGIACSTACDPGQRCSNGSCICDATSCPDGCCTANICALQRDCGGCSATACSWGTLASPSTARTQAFAFLLPNEKVIVVGGSTSTGATVVTDVFDPASGTWQQGPSMNFARSKGPFVQLPNGNILAIGGAAAPNQAVVEMLDVVQNKWFVRAPVNTAREGAFAVVLGDGNVMYGGGHEPGSFFVKIMTVETYSPEANTWTNVTGLNDPADDYSSILLASGRILVGRFEGVQIFDPDGDIWISYGPSSIPHHMVPLISLGGNRVLIAGGTGQNGQMTSTAEIFSSVGWSAANAMSEPRGAYVVSHLSNGRILTAGGLDSGRSATATVEVFDPSSGLWSVLPPLPQARSYSAAIRLADGKVVVVGGDDSTPSPTSSAFIYK